MLTSEFEQVIIIDLDHSIWLK